MNNHAGTTLTRPVGKPQSYINADKVVSLRGRAVSGTRDHITWL